MSRVSPTARLSALLPLLAVATAQAQGAGVNQYGNPLKHPAKPTTAAITAEELRTRLYIFADDSMMGRQVGREGNMKGTDYIAAELKRLGVEPGGENGTYFQTLPYVQRKFTDRSTLSVNGAALAFNGDFVPVPGATAPKAISGAQVIYGGVAGDTTRQITPEQAAGKFVILSAAAARPLGAAPAGGPAVQASFEGGCPVAGGNGQFAAGAARGGFAGFGGGNAAARFPNAVAVATVDLDALSPASRAALNNPQAQQSGGGRGAAGAPGGATAPDLVVVANGKVGIVRDGALAAGTLPAGWTPATVKTKADSMAKKSADSSARVAARRDSLIATAKALLAARTRSGSLTFDGERIALDSTQILTLACQPAAGGRPAGGAGNAPRTGANTGGGAPAGPPPATLRLTSAAAAKLLGRALDGAQPGATGGTVTAALDYVEQPTKFGRNVVGIIRGSDPKLAGEYVAIGGHNDHIGYSAPVDHDSLKAWNNANLRLQMASGDLRAITAEQRASIKVNMDSIRKLHPVARMDSISNGADDDGSGSMAVLEIAEAISKMPVKPKRSIVFVWHTGEEAGLVGSRFFAANPTVPVDSIVAQINIDMIGRGRAEDVIGGGPTYVGAVGSKRLSQELYRDMLSANAKQKTPLTIDYRFDDATLGVATDGKPASWPGYNNIYGRSDHANYANKCIPIVFFFTGLHGDYHQRTDEPQYIDYPHYAAITNYVRDLLVDVGNRATRPALDNVCARR